MTTRNKILLSVGAVCLVAVIAVVAVVAVFAARTQNVTSNITVKYTAREVVGKVSAKYYVGGDTTGVDLEKQGGGTEIEFNVGNSSAGGTLQTKDNTEIDLSEQAENKLFVVFEYKFTNSGEQDYKVSLTCTHPSEAFIVYAYESEEQDATVTAGTWSKATHDAEHKQEKGDNSFFSDVVVAKKSEADTEHYFYVVVYLDETASGADAELTADFSWTLTGVPSAAA